MTTGENPFLHFFCMNDKQTGHTRRIRYSGTHPREFSEKYKELDPGKYPDDVERIRQKGQTPAGMHLPVCVSEILQVLDLRPGMNGIDCTLGYGGHSSMILPRIMPGGYLIGIDIDSAELQKTRRRIQSLGYDGSRFDARHINFSRINDCLNTRPEGFDFVLADLGVSSMQLDTPHRGFSFKNPAPLDLRMDGSSGETAAQMLLRITEASLIDLLVENADEPYAELLGRTVHAKRTECLTTSGLAEVVTESLKKSGVKPEECKPAVQRVFQALRIEINREFEALDQLLHVIPECLKSGGKAVFLTFHSGEDRRVKKSFKVLTEQGIYTECARRPVRPSFQEQRDNPRSSSAKLRWAVK